MTWKLPNSLLASRSSDKSKYSRPRTALTTRTGRHQPVPPNQRALDAQGNRYVADHGNSRVLEYDTPLSAGATADRVFGQPDFTHNAANNGSLSANSLYSPYGVARDAQGNLYVADNDNNRVLEYDQTNDQALFNLWLPLVVR
jgi:sugar lactone lactonase YvrE